MSSRTRLSVDSLDCRIVPATLRVDDDGAQFGAATQFNSIQAAIDSATTGDTILVAPGSYAELLRVGTDNATNNWPVSLYGRNLDGLEIKSSVQYAAVIKAPAGADPDSVLLDVSYSKGVAINGFTFDGTGTIGAVEVNQRGSVDLRRNLFRDVDQAGGVAVYVGFDNGGTAVVQNNLFQSYHSAGVMADGPFSSVTVNKNTFTGAGPVDRIQFGVQISRNASGQVSNNLFTGHIYQPALPRPAFDGGELLAAGDGGELLTAVDGGELLKAADGELAAGKPVDGGAESLDPLDNRLTAAAILVFQAGEVTITNNTISANQTGVYVSDQSGTVVVQKNTVSGSTLDGITLDIARGSTLVINNTVADSARDGIHIQSQSFNNTITRNTVTGSGRFGIASVPTVFDLGNGSTAQVAPLNNIIANNTVSGSVAYDLFAQAADGGDGINDLWSANTFGTKNRPGLR